MILAGPTILPGAVNSLAPIRPDPVRQRSRRRHLSLPHRAVRRSRTRRQFDRDHLAATACSCSTPTARPSAAAAVLARNQDAHLTTGPLHRQLALALGSLVQDRGLHAGRFPDVKVIAHEKTKMMMAGPAIEFNKPGLEQQLPAYLAQLEQRIAKAEAATPPPANLPQLKQALADGRFFLEQKNSVHHTLPNQTYTDKLTLHARRSRDPGAAPRSRGHAGRFVPVSAEGEDRDHRRSAGQSGLVRA